MPMNVDIQSRVIKIASNKAVNSKAKLAIRKRFYELKNEEITLEEVQEDFNTKIAEFDAQLNAILDQLKSVPSVQTADVPPAKAAPKDYGDEEEIIVPKPVEKRQPGIQVRMQEELDATPDDNTDVEVPFEAEETQ